jgi:TPR repeat protein
MKTFITLAWLMLFIPFVSGQSANSQSRFVPVMLPHGITIDLPGTWEIAGASMVQEMSNRVEAVIDLSGLAVERIREYEALLVAGRIIDDSIAKVSIMYKAIGPYSQSEVSTWTGADIRKWELASQKELTGAASAIPGFVWSGADRMRFENKYFMASQYDRIHQASGQEMAVIMFNYFDISAVQITASFSKKDKLLWEPIIMRIVASLRMGRASDERAAAQDEVVPKDAAKAVEWYRRNAERGDAEAQFNLGIKYESGDGIAKDVTEAVKWWFKAAEQGQVEAQFNLGVCYATGDGVSKDATKAVEWYTKAANQGNAEAQNNLGRCYKNGDGVPRDAAKAVEWYAKAALQGDLSAQYNLGLSYSAGDGIAKDTAKAADWWSKAAVQGLAEAQYNLGISYAKGQGIPIDALQAYYWLYLANASGDTKARKALDTLAKAMPASQIAEAERLAREFKPGKEIAQRKEFHEPSQTFEAAMRSAESGNARAQGEVGFHYQKGVGISANLNEAIKWYTRAAENGDSFAQTKLGLCYSDGEGVPENELIAVKWWTKAAHQGMMDAQRLLGYAYASGKGATRDEVEAMKWFRKCAENGDADGQRMVGFYYEHGNGVEKDATEAARWFLLAAGRGDLYSQKTLSIAYLQGKGVRKDVSQALRWGLKAAEQGDSKTQAIVGLCYAAGDGTAKDQPEAYLWWTLAAEQADEYAKKNLPILKLQMTAAEIVEGCRRVNDFKSRHAKNSAALESNHK